MLSNPASVHQEQVGRDRKAYDLAREFLLRFPEVTPEVLDKHVNSPEASRPGELPKIYQRLVSSAQNMGMMPRVIGDAIGGIDNLGSVLFGFNPAAVANEYALDDAKLLNEIITQLGPSGQVRQEKNSLWPRFSKAVLSGAAFLSQFTSGDEFHNWAKFFDGDVRARPALPMLLDQEITGFGFALACDFLKEIGYVNFGKPDTHLKKIFSELKLSPHSSDYQVFKAISRIAGHVGVAPYNVDKLFWLTGSGNFYRSAIHIGRQRENFIAFARPHLLALAT